MSDAPSIGNILKNGMPPELRDGIVRAKVISLPDRIEQSDKPLRIKGEVVNVDQSGKVQIKTDKGPVVVQINQPSAVQKGKPVEINVAKDNTDNIAYIRPATTKVERPPQPNNPAKTDVPYINTPRQATLTPETIVQAPQIAVEYITAPSVTDVFPINQVQNTALSATSFIPSDVYNLTVPSALQEMITASSALPPIKNSLLFLTPALNNEPVDTISQERLNVFSDKIPLSVIAAKTLSAPLQEPITVNNINDVIPRNVIENVQVSSVSLKNVLLFKIEDDQSIRSDSAPREIIEHGNLRAGETKAVIEGFTKEQHFPVLQFLNIPHDENARYALQTPVQDIPRGASFSIENIQTTIETQALVPPNTQNQPAVASLPTLAPLPPTSFFLTPEIWGSLQDIQTTLHQYSPNIAQSFTGMMPSPSVPQQMGAAALFFLAAMRSGDIQSWLGEKAIDVLKRAGKGDLISKLSGEMSSLARMNADSAGGEWRMLSMPMAWQSEIHKVVVHYRKEENPEQKDESKGGGTTRFVMDLNLSKIGKVQVDGLFKASDKRLDAILRTEQSFSGSMKAEMRRIYKDALDETEITGELSFQDTPEHWVNINAGENVDFDQDV